MQDFTFDIRLGEKVYPLVFNLNVMEKIQEEYGSIDKWGKLTDGTQSEPNAKAIIFGFREMINEAIDIENENLKEPKEFLSLKQVGRLITKAGLENSAKKLNEAVINSTKEEHPKNM